MVRTSSRLPRTGGFTLMEVVITLIVIGVLATIGARIMSTAFQTYFAGREIAQDDAQVRYALERMTRELRTVRSPADLTISTQNKIKFVDSASSTVSYRLIGTQLQRSQDNEATYQPLAENINTLAITYLRNDGQTAELFSGNPLLVYYVTVQLRVVSQGVVDMTYRSTIKPVAF
jgi:prepilin-type N-terminal cleavage/methylation domain-containing protein